MVNDAEALTRIKRMDEAALGRFGEAIWSNIFKASGAMYIPLKDINNGGAPMAIAGNGKTVLPDFDVSAEHWTVFVDSKCKSHPIRYRKLNQLRHGIDRRNYEAYLRAGENFRKRSAIGIVELFEDESNSRWSGLVLCKSLRDLGEPFQGESNQRHMVYWKHKDFSNLDTLQPAELLGVALGTKSVSYKFELERIFARLTQAQLF